MSSSPAPHTSSPAPTLSGERSNSIGAPVTRFLQDIAKVNAQPGSCQSEFSNLENLCQQTADVQQPLQQLQTATVTPTNPQQPQSRIIQAIPGMDQTIPRTVQTIPGRTVDDPSFVGTAAMQQQTNVGHPQQPQQPQHQQQQFLEVQGQSGDGNLDELTLTNIISASNNNNNSNTTTIITTSTTNTSSQTLSNLTHNNNNNNNNSNNNNNPSIDTAIDNNSISAETIDANENVSAALLISSDQSNNLTNSTNSEQIKANAVQSQQQITKIISMPATPSTPVVSGQQQQSQTSLSTVANAAVAIASASSASSANTNLNVIVSQPLSHFMKTVNIGSSTKTGIFVPNVIATNLTQPYNVQHQYGLHPNSSGPAPNVTVNPNGNFNTNSNAALRPGFHTFRNYNIQQNSINFNVINPNNVNNTNASNNNASITSPILAAQLQTINQIASNQAQNTNMIHYSGVNSSNGQSTMAAAAVAAGRFGDLNDRRAERRNPPADLNLQNSAATGGGQITRSMTPQHQQQQPSQSTASTSPTMVSSPSSTNLAVKFSANLTAKKPVEALGQGLLARGPGSASSSSPSSSVTSPGASSLHQTIENDPNNQNDQQIRVLTPSEIMRTLPSFPNQDIACNIDATKSNLTISTNSVSVTAVTTTCTNVLVANHTEMPNISNQILSSNHTAANANINNANNNYNSCSINQSTISASSSNDNHHYHTNNNNNHNPAIIQCLPSSPTSTTTITTSVALKTVRVEPKNKNVKNMFYQLSYSLCSILM